MKLVNDWRRSWRMFSVQAMLVASAIQGAWEFIPDDLKAQLPQGVVHWLTIALLVFGVVGRLIEQPKVSGGQQ